MARTRETEKLTNSPLVLSLCQVRFSRLEAMGEYIPAILKELRADFPVNLSGQVQEVVMGVQGIRTSDRQRWEFVSQERHSSVVVNDGFVTFQTTDYDHF